MNFMCAHAHILSLLSELILAGRLHAFVHANDSRHCLEVIVAARTWLDGRPSGFFLSGLQKLEFGCCSLFPSWSG